MEGNYSVEEQGQQNDYLEWCRRMLIGFERYEE
jgi:hypothetical protein